MPRVEQQPRVDELTRPQQMLLIGKFGSSLIVPVVWMIWLSIRLSLP